MKGEEEHEEKRDARKDRDIDFSYEEIKNTECKLPQLSWQQRQTEDLKVVGSNPTGSMIFLKGKRG